METPTRARRRKLDTAKADLEPRVYSGGQGVHRKVESEGLEEKYRAAIDGGYPNDEPVGQRWGKVESAVWRRRRTHSPTAPRCLRGHGTEERRVTSGGLAASPGGTGGSGPISEREVASDALSVVGRLNSTLHVAKAT